MKKIFYISLMAASLNFVSCLEAKADVKRLSVVELFTSQGCSSCPPADAFLGELAMRSDVLALAYHVDYWDYIGWKDIYAQSDFSDRQRTYAHQFNLRYVYTPQMVVAGAAEDSGNKRRQIIKSIENDLQLKADLSLSVENNHIILHANTDYQNTNVYLVSFHEEVKTDVRKGENQGKTLTEYHVVDDLALLGPWQGKEARFDLATKELDASLSYGVFVQRMDDLRILGGFRIK